MWAGIGEAQKLALIFLGSFFQLVLMIAMQVGGTRRDLVEAAYTLGASGLGHRQARADPRRRAADRRDRCASCSAGPGPYVIVAELIGASSGIGHMITDSQALLATDQIIFGIITIGVIGLVSDWVFKRANRAMFGWAAL